MVDCLHYMKFRLWAKFDDEFAIYEETPGQCLKRYMFPLSKASSGLPKANKPKEPILTKQINLEEMCWEKLK